MTDKIISIVVIVLVFVMVCFLVMCAVEIILGIRERRDQAPAQENNSNNQNNVQPIYIPFYGMPQMQMAQPVPVVQETAVTAPAPAPAPVVEKKKEEPAPVVEEKKEEPAPVVEENESEVAFEVKAERLTLKQAYAELPATKKKLYDKLMNEIVSLEKVRCKESMYAYTVMQGQSTIARLKISRGIIMLDVTLVNAELKAYGKETGNKVKTKPTRFKIVADADLAPAVFTLKVANNTALEARGVKPENN
jgi:type IV secretory pathway VirB10-like protein